MANPPIYKSYTFRGKDPAIDDLRTIAEDVFGEAVSGRSIKAIHDEGGPSRAAMRSWFFGKTKRPTNATIEAAGRAMGYERAWRKRKLNP